MNVDFQIRADERRGRFLALVAPQRLSGAELSLQIGFLAQATPARQRDWWNDDRRELCDAAKTRLLTTRNSERGTRNADFHHD